MSFSAYESYHTVDGNDNLAATMLLIHYTGVHTNPTTTLTTAKVGKVHQPTISSAGSSEECEDISSLGGVITRMPLRIKALRLKVIELLECCDQDLGKTSLEQPVEA